MPEGYEIGWALRTGYPSWMQEGEEPEEFDEDRAYEQARDSVFDCYDDFD